MGYCYLPAFLSLINFGLWGLFAKLSVNHVDSKNALFYQTIGVLIAGLIVFYMMNFKASTNVKGIVFGLLTGLTYGAGCLFFFFAVTRGNLATIVTLTALYPVITIFLSYFILHETISLRQGIAIVFALVAMILFTG
jgi:transporter family protein